MLHSLSIGNTTVFIRKHMLQESRETASGNNQEYEEITSWNYIQYCNSSMGRRKWELGKKLISLYEHKIIL